MKQIPDKSIDLILCDLPYAMTGMKWDIIIPFDKLWIEYKRIIKDGRAIVLTASQPFTSALVMSNPTWFKHEWIWEKNNASNFANAKKAPLKKHESILVFSDPKHKPHYYPQDLIKVNWLCSNKRNGGNNYKLGTRNKPDYIQENTNYPKSVLRFNVERGLHPTQKPTALFDYLIKTYSLEGDLVLDNCGGSGTTAISCLNTNRKYLIMEQDLEYHSVINKRIEDYIITKKDNSLKGL